MEHPELFTLAASQRGLFTRRQARASGYSAKQIAARLLDGRWRQVLGSTLAAGHQPSTPELLDLAAYLTAGQPAVLSGPSAARFYGMPVPESAPCITVPRSRHLSRLGIIQLRGRLDDREAALIDGVLVTSKARTAIDCLRLLAYDDAIAFLDRALQQRWTHPEVLAARVAEGEQLRGIEQLRRLAREARTGTHSEAERAAAKLFRQGGIEGWRANHEVWHGELLLGIVDYGFPFAKLAVEIDGRAWHTDLEAFERDRRRQNALVNAGWTVLRFTWADLTDRPDAVLAEVRRALDRLAA